MGGSGANRNRGRGPRRLASGVGGCCGTHPSLHLLAGSARLTAMHLEPSRYTIAPSSWRCRRKNETGSLTRMMAISAMHLRHAASRMRVARSLGSCISHDGIGCWRYISVNESEQSRARACHWGVGMRARTAKFSDTATRKPASENAEFVSKKGGAETQLNARKRARRTAVGCTSLMVRSVPGSAPHDRRISA